MMFETSKHVPKTEKCCCVFKDKCIFIIIIIIITITITISVTVTVTVNVIVIVMIVVIVIAIVIAIVIVNTFITNYYHICLDLSKHYSRNGALLNCKRFCFSCH